MNIASTIKQHPYAVAGAVFGGFVLLVFLMRAGGGGAQQSSDGGTLQTIAAANAQQSQLAAQVGAANAQLSSQNYQTGLAAQVQNNQVLATQQTAQYQTDAQLIAALAANQSTQQQTTAQLSAYQMQTDLAKQQSFLEAGVANNTLTTNLQAAEDTNATNLAAYNSQVSYATNLANIQGMLTALGITTQAQTETDAYNYATKVNQNQYDLNNQIVGLVGQAGLNHGTTSLENSLTAILSGVQNQPTIGVAAENATAVNSAASANVWQSFWNSVGAIGSTVTKGLMAPAAIA